jgi:hypothetical protein
VIPERKVGRIRIGRRWRRNRRRLRRNRRRWRTRRTRETYKQAENIRIVTWMTRTFLGNDL